jgi:hypothetical protein
VEDSKQARPYLTGHTLVPECDCNSFLIYSQLYTITDLLISPYYYA